jgi:hypothetical protein
MRNVKIVNNILLNADTNHPVFCPLIHEGVNIAPCSSNCGWFDAQNFALKKDKAELRAVCNNTATLGLLQSIETETPAQALKLIR